MSSLYKYIFSNGILGNFSGINTDTVETTMKGFKSEVESSIRVFIEKYRLNFYIDKEDEVESILDNLFKAWIIQKGEEKIYVIIDEYDHFANEITLPLHTKLTDEMIEYVIQSYKNIVEHYI